MGAEAALENRHGETSSPCAPSASSSLGFIGTGDRVPRSRCHARAGPVPSQAGERAVAGKADVECDDAMRGGRLGSGRHGWICPITRGLGWRSVIGWVTGRNTMLALLKEWRELYVHELYFVEHIFTVSHSGSSRSYY